MALGEVYGRLETMWEHDRIDYNSTPNWASGNTDGASHVTVLDGPAAAGPFGEVACEPVVASPLLASGTWDEVVEALRCEPGYAFYNILRVDDDGYEVRLASGSGNCREAACRRACKPQAHAGRARWSTSAPRFLLSARGRLL
jgi:hypothetical protein